MIASNPKMEKSIYEFQDDIGDLNESLECLPWTQFFAIYMQISTFLTLTLYGLTVKNIFV